MGENHFLQRSFQVSNRQSAVNGSHSTVAEAAVYSDSSLWYSMLASTSHAYQRCVPPRGLFYVSKKKGVRRLLFALYFIQSNHPEFPDSSYWSDEYFIACPCETTIKLNSVTLSIYFDYGSFTACIIENPRSNDDHFIIRISLGLISASSIASHPSFSLQTIS